MPSNVEIKAHLNDVAAAEAIASQLSHADPELIRQEDIFFRCEGARLKLRILDADRGELIRYERPDTAEPRCSHYSLARTSDPESLLEILSDSLGRVGVVKKIRKLYLVGQMRVHIDHVEHLGNFLELEVVLAPGQTVAEGKSIAEALLAKFGIKSDERVGEAYINLLMKRGKA